MPHIAAVMAYSGAVTFSTAEGTESSDPMYPLRLLRAALAASISFSVISAQTGNEVVFVGSSTSGSVDQHVFAESSSGSVLVASGVSYTDNVTGAVWSDQGRRLYVGQSLMNRVAVAEWDGANASWSTFYSAAGACYGVHMDRSRQILWTLAPGAAGSRQLVGLDAALGSPGYGQVVAQSSSLSSTLRERWGLSFSGNLAAVPMALLGTLDVVDLDPGSPNYLQVVVSTPVPGASGITIAVDLKISVDDRYIYLLYTGVGPSGLAVYDMTAGAFLDFGAQLGVQDFQLPLTVPNTMDLAIDSSFAVVSGQGGAGWAGRVDFDYVNPTNTAFTPWSALTLPGADGISLSPEGARAAVSSTPTFLNAPSELHIVDVNTGSALQSVVLSSMWNVYTTAWQDASPLATYATFGASCSGTLGVPTLSAQVGSRPAMGGAFALALGGLPAGGALVATGLSASATTSGLPLPLDLSALGMIGCSQLVDAFVVDFVSGGGGSATWNWTLPTQPSLFGAVFYNQAFVLDPAANAFGWTATNAGVGTLGY